MSDNGGQERTERATPKSRKEARRKGKVAHSREVSSVLIIMTAIGIFYFVGSWVLGIIFEVIHSIYGQLDTLRFNEIGDVHVFMVEIFKKMSLIFIPFFLPLLIAGVAGSIGQIGFEIHGEPLRPKLTKFNPIYGLKKLVSLKSLVELMKSIFKIFVISGIAYAVFKKESRKLSSLMQYEVGDILLFVSRTAFKILLFVCFALIIMAVLDYIYQRWQYEMDLKMTKQEVKDERMQREGDPKVKGRIRKAQLDMAARRTPDDGNDS